MDAQTMHGLLTTWQTDHSFKIEEVCIYAGGQQRRSTVSRFLHSRTVLSRFLSTLFTFDPQYNFASVSQEVHYKDTVSHFV